MSALHRLPEPVTAAFLGIVIAALSSMITTGVIAALVAWKVCK